MPLVAAYHRPRTLEEALSLLAEPDHTVLAGGTTINADRDASDVEVVDLQALDLDAIVADGARVRIGAMATLGSVAESGLVPEWLQIIARAESPSTLRNLATVGGSVATRSGESLFLAALLVSDAYVEMAGADGQSLSALVEHGVPDEAIITAVSIDASGKGGTALTGRTPADVPIVAAVARTADGRTTLALTGVAATPVLADPNDPTAGLTPPADFRGTAVYRLMLARTLSERAVEAAR
ncbi:MAG: hypothetical protein GXP35_00040 [Actinobacteria bacterium]|nr:hypothetical protein [Actinomycetota bacterium]